MNVRWKIGLGVGVLACAGASCGKDDSGGDGDGGAESGGLVSITADGGDSAADGGTGAEEGEGDGGEGDDDDDDDDADSDDDDDETGDGPKFDLPGVPDAGGGEEGCECGSELGFSYIWIANSNESTVSKIDTQTMVEEGRYFTRADMNGNPSRTSVNLTGDAVAVANRNGGLIKVFAQEADCDPDKNGQPGVQTSTGAADIRAWDDDDCVGWYLDFDFNAQRPVAWTSGVQNPDTCEYENQRVWTSGCNSLASQEPEVVLVDGETGEIVDQVTVTGFVCTGFGPYGGAVDSNNDFWITSNSNASQLARISITDMGFQVWDVPVWAYGMTVDSMDRPWVTVNQASQFNAAAARFNPITETWDLADSMAVRGYSGIQEDGEGRMWLNYGVWDGNSQMGLTYVDRDALTVGPPIDIPGAVSWLNGISIDLDARVWTVSPQANTAFRYQPDSGMIDSYGGLVFPYTYSDMTGWGLQTSACGSPEG